MMLASMHWLIVSLYVLAPLVGGAWALSRLRRGKAGPIVSLLGTLFIGAAVATALVVFYSRIVGARVGSFQLMLAIYFATSMLLIMKAIDALLVRKIGGAVRRRWRASASSAVSLSVAGNLLRAALLIGVGIPFVLSNFLIYRPRAVLRDDPAKRLQAAYTPVQFQSLDGVRLAGWWIPATHGEGSYRTKTVVVCHGLAGSKAHQLQLVRRLLASGYNALIFDFRAHGQSGGQLTTLGDLERRDVLGAVRWLRANHPEQAQRIVGLGVSTGAAALIAAAIDPSDEGAAIEAIAVYGAFDELQPVVREFARTTFMPPMDWLAPKLGLPIASATTGADLVHFAPARMVPDLWPRPILVIHATHDPIVPFESGRRLFDAASFPKRQFWIQQSDLNGALNDAQAAEVVLDFFDHARPMKVI